MMILISEIVFSGFVSKVINDIVDVSKDKIVKAVKSKNTNHQNLEAQIYNVIVNVLNKITNNQYENNQDSIYNVAEVFLKSFKGNDKDESGKISTCLRSLGLNADEDKRLEFKVLLCEELGRNEYSELFRAILLLLLEQNRKYNNVVYEQLNQKLDEVIKSINNREHSNTKKKIESRTQKYADKWNDNMFLNDFSEWEENAGINIKLRDVYIENHLPYFIWRNNSRKSSGLRELLLKYIINNSNKSQMLLILGQPGIGKSTLITWIVANFADKAVDMLVYQFASDVKNVNKNNFGIKKKYLVLGEIKLPLNELEGKILILDGFDEINVGNDRLEILNGLYRDLIKDNLLHNFSLIINCRENYIRDMYKVECDYITLQPWEGNQIQSFCNIYCKKTKHSISEEAMNRILKKKEIFGIPLILYLVLSLEISVEKEGSVVDIYDQIFSLEEGGIYDRCFKNLKKSKMERYDEPHWSRLIKKQIHQISRDIAMWMFEINFDEASIPREEYENICSIVIQDQKFQENGYTEQDFLIGNYFKLVRHCEGVGTEKICFVHRSIYEYFVAETIFNSIENALLDLSNESQREFAGNIAKYLKMGDLSPTISEYLEYKIRKLYNSLETRKQKNFYYWWETAIDKMMDVGMFYYSEPIQHCSNSIYMEVKCFINLVKILRLVLKIEQKKYIMYNVKRECLEHYIKYCATVYPIWRKKFKSERLDLRKMYLKGLDLRGINLEEADLSDAYLVEANLSDAKLVKTNLQRAHLKGVPLCKADLREANLESANLREADLRGAIIELINDQYTNLEEPKLKSANLKGAYLNNSIWREKDIYRVRQLKKTIFTSLIIDDERSTRKVEKKAIFPSKK